MDTMTSAEMNAALDVIRKASERTDHTCVKCGERFLLYLVGLKGPLMKIRNDDDIGQLCADCDETETGITRSEA